MMRVSPAARISLGLVFITLSIVMLGNFIGLIPDQSHLDMESRKKTAESLAVHCSVAAQHNNITIMRTTIKSLTNSDPEILSLGIRRADGRYVTQAGNHQLHWIAPRGEESTELHWQVPIFKGKKRWTTLEISFKPRNSVSVLGYRLSPFTILILFFTVMSFTLFTFFLKRSMRYLDPSAVMPSRVKYALDTLTEGVLILDTKERIALANSVFIDNVGSTENTLMGLKASVLNWIDPETNKPPDGLPWIQTILKGEKVSGILLSITTKSKGVINYVVNCAPVLDLKGKCRGAVVTFDDVTEVERQSFQLSKMVELLQMSRDKIKLKNQELEVLASKDSLTGCLNRRAFYEMAEQCIDESSAEGAGLACIMADIDLFKSINDRYGHAVGDQVIKFIAETLHSSVREKDLVCRYGGEEFCLILPDCDADDAALVAEKIRHKIQANSNQCIPEKMGLPITVSIGVSNSSGRIRNFEELMKQADIALYQAKTAGRNRVISFNREETNKDLSGA